MKKQVLVLLCALVSPALAGNEDIAAVGLWMKSVKNGQTADPYGGTIEACAAAVAQARKANLAVLADDKFFEFGGEPDGNGSFTLTIDQADALCTEAAGLHVTLEATKVFVDVTRLMYMLERDPGGRFAEALPKHANACNKAVGSLLAAKLAPTTPFEVKDYDGKQVLAKTIGEIKSGVCEALRKAGKQYAQAEAAEAAKARAPFIKAGIQGDKLDLMMQYDGSVFLPGGASSGDLKKYAKASTLFVWLTSDPDAHDNVVHTVRRYQFTGNTLVKDSEKTYRKKRGAKLGAAPFR